ncbi:hypothetical protein EAE96_005027 [Botrytis aclada]|nr:hypothetical protein EAE96_005027 [Botrytis aclada]
MAESESNVSNPLFDRDHEDYFFFGLELIPYFPYKAYHMNILKYHLPNGRFQQEKHLDLPTMLPEIVALIFSHIIDEPSIDPAAGNKLKGSIFILDPVFLSRRIHDYPGSDDEGEHGPRKSHPMPITALLFQKETRPIYAPTIGVDTKSWRTQNTKGWRDHRSTQRILERSIYRNTSEGTYSQLVQFAYSLALHEDFQIPCESYIWWSPVRKFSILKLFLVWFWSRFGIYINTCNWGMYPKAFSVGNLLQYHRLEHLTLRFSTKTINLRRGAMHMNMRHFIRSLTEKRCGDKGCKEGDICKKIYCGDHSLFPNLRNITYLNRNHHTEGTTEARCDTMRTGWSRRLIKHFQDVKLSESMEVIFDVYADADEESCDGDSCDSDGETGSNWDEDLYKDYDLKNYYYESNETDTPSLLHDRQLAVQDCIRRLLMPNSLLKGNTNDLPEDLGLRELFQDLEI